MASCNFSARPWASPTNEESCVPGIPLDAQVLGGGLFVQIPILR